LNVSILYNSFTGGELSPLLAARVDTPNYASGAKRMENAIPLLTGGLRKRPGTWYAGKTADNRAAVLIDWLLADGTSLLVELTAHPEGGLLFTIYNETFRTLYRYVYEWPSGPEFSDIGKIRHAVGNGIVPDKTTQNFILFTSEEYKQMAVLNVTRSEGAYTFSVSGFELKNNGEEGPVPGYVKDIAFYGGRLYLGGMTSSMGSPTRVMASRPPDSMTGFYRYDDFTPGALAGDAIVIDENDMGGSGIQWVFAARRFLTATGRSSWADAGEVPTPAAFDMNIIEYAGANGLKPAASKEIIVYAGRDGRTLRALIWQYDSGYGGYMDADISAPAAHLFSSGIVSYAVMDYPFPTIWIVNGAGELISCSVNIAAGITAFARHTLGNAKPAGGNPFYAYAETVEVARRKDRDRLYVVVRRNEQDAEGVLREVRCIEWLELEDLVTADYTESHYVDSGTRVEFPEGEESDVIEGLERLRGRTVNVFADGSLFPPVEVDDEGVIHLSEKVRKAHIGLPMKTLLSLNTAQIPANGTSYGKKRRIEKVLLSLYRTIGGSAGTKEDNGEPVITQRFGSYGYGDPVEPYTGIVEIYVSGNVDAEGSLFLVHNEATPFNALAVVERVAILEA
jgi:hypothetical protein